MGERAPRHPRRGARHKTFRPPATLPAALCADGCAVPTGWWRSTGVDLTVRTWGKRWGLMGPNGAGKSTLLRILAGLLLPSSGHAKGAGGLSAATERSALARQVGYVAADERGLPPWLSPRELLAFYAALYGYRRRAALARADMLLDEVGLGAHATRPLRELSTGMRRRTALARGLLGSPRVLLLDEPTRGVDPRRRDRAPRAAPSRAPAWGLDGDRHS